MTSGNPRTPAITTVDQKMPSETEILFISTQDFEANEPHQLLSAAGFVLYCAPYQKLAEALAHHAGIEVVIFNAETISHPEKFHSLLKLAEKLKTNAATAHIRLFCVGIAPHLMSEAEPHHFDELMFGRLRWPAVMARLKSQKRLTTIAAEINRRNQLAEHFGSAPITALSEQTPLNNPSILITGRPNGFALLEQSLSPFATLVGALAESAANDYLTRDDFDMIIINGGSQPTRYLSFIEDVRRNPAHFNLPILMVTRKTELANSHIAFETGLTDIIEAPINQNELTHRVQCLIREYRCLKAITKIYKDSRHIAANDALTGLYTYGFFETHLQETIADHKNENRFFTLIKLTIINLNEINRTYGALAGDRVLKSVADIVLTLIRAEDLPSRLSGRTFGITLPGTTHQDATHLLNRMEGLLKHTQFINESEGEAIRVEFDAEIIDAGGITTAEELISKTKANPLPTRQIIAA